MLTSKRARLAWVMTALAMAGCHHPSVRSQSNNAPAMPARFVENKSLPTVVSQTMAVEPASHAEQSFVADQIRSESANQLAQHDPMAVTSPLFSLASLPSDRQRSTDPRDDLALAFPKVATQQKSEEQSSTNSDQATNQISDDQQRGGSSEKDKSKDAEDEKLAEKEKSPADKPAPAPTESAKIQLAQPVQVGTYSLDQLIALAQANNPAIREAEAAVAKADGLRYQVGLRPNPMVGYNGTQLADQKTDQHTVFVSQDIVTAQKLQRNTGVLCLEVENLKWQAEIQRRAVSGDVKQLFFETLGAQQKLELSKKFVEMAEKAVEISRQRKKAGEGTEVDVLQSEVQLQQIAVSNRQQAAALTGAWTRMAAVVGQPEMQLGLIDGVLPTDPRVVDWEAEYARLCAESPELMAAQTRVARARANLDRQRVQCTPNVSWMLGAGYDRATDSQLINTQVGIPLPINNQNEGNISAANAEYCRALQEVRRLQLAIRTRLASASQAYQSSAASVDLYKSAVIPKAEKMLELAELTFRAGEIDFLQVLTIRRTYFDSMLEYLNARTQLAQANANIEELLLSGSLNGGTDSGFDDGLRDQSLNGQ